MIREDSYVGKSIISVGDVEILDIQFDTRDMVVNVTVKNQDHFMTTVLMPQKAHPLSSFQVIYPAEEKVE